MECVKSHLKAKNGQKYRTIQTVIAKQFLLNEKFSQQQYGNSVERAEILLLNNYNNW